MMQDFSINILLSSGKRKSLNELDQELAEDAAGINLFNSHLIMWVADGAPGAIVSSDSSIDGSHFGSRVLAKRVGAAFVYTVKKSLKNKNSFHFDDQFLKVFKSSIEKLMIKTFEKKRLNEYFLSIKDKLPIAATKNGKVYSLQWSTTFIGVIVNLDNRKTSSIVFGDAIGVYFDKNNKMKFIDTKKGRLFFNWSIPVIPKDVKEDNNSIQYQNIVADYNLLFKEKDLKIENSVVINEIALMSDGIASINDLKKIKIKSLLGLSDFFKKTDDDKSIITFKFINEDEEELFDSIHEFSVIEEEEEEKTITKEDEITLNPITSSGTTNKVLIEPTSKVTQSKIDIQVDKTKSPTFNELDKQKNVQNDRDFSVSSTSQLFDVILIEKSDLYFYYSILNKKTNTKYLVKYLKRKEAKNYLYVRTSEWQVSHGAYLFYTSEEFIDKKTKLHIDLLMKEYFEKEKVDPYRYKRFLIRLPSLSEKNSYETINKIKGNQDIIKIVYKGIVNWFYDILKRGYVDFSLKWSEIYYLNEPSSLLPITIWHLINENINNDHLKTIIQNNYYLVRHIENLLENIGLSNKVSFTFDKRNKSELPNEYKSNYLQNSAVNHPENWKINNYNETIESFDPTAIFLITVLKYFLTLSFCAYFDYNLQGLRFYDETLTNLFFRIAEVIYYHKEKNLPWWNLDKNRTNKKTDEIVYKYLKYLICNEKEGKEVDKFISNRKEQLKQSQQPSYGLNDSDIDYYVHQLTEIKELSEKIRKSKSHPLNKDNKLIKLLEPPMTKDTMSAIDAIMLRVILTFIDDFPFKASNVKSKSLTLDIIKDKLIKEFERLFP